MVMRDETYGSDELERLNATQTKLLAIATDISQWDAIDSLMLK